MANEDTRFKSILFLHMSQMMMMAAQAVCLVAVFLAQRSTSKRCQMSSKVTKYRKRVASDGFDKVDEGSSDCHSDGATATSFRRKKRAKRVVENDASMVNLAKSLEKIAEAIEKISKSMTELINQNDNDVPGNVIWAQLEEIGVKPELMPKVYLHIVLNHNAKRAFCGIPVDMRKELLPHIVPGYPDNIPPLH